MTDHHHHHHAEPHSTEARLAQAEAHCAARGARLTDVRREVLALVLGSGKPVGAYDLLNQLRGDKRNAAPPTVYRALDFLMEQGLIHKLERLSAYVACAHGLDHPCEAGCDHHHAAQFLICERCRQVTELNDNSVSDALIRAARKGGFQPSASTVEVNGLCAACAGAA